MRYKVTVSYDGSQFHGWQIQNEVRTVQEELEKCLSKIVKKQTTIHGSGRTDAKVHASRQVFHFDASLNMTCDNWYKALNALCPDDIYIQKVEEVDDDFHARYDVTSKEYCYYVNMGDYDVFNKNYVYQFNHVLDVGQMKEAASYLIGTHDFTSYNATPLDEIENQVRTLYALEITQKDDVLEFKITGTGFLRYMIRMIVGALIECGKHKLNPEDIKEKLELKTKATVPFRAPAEGLYLKRVNYD
ncbi:tRNA pseudouridine(38-40) synthase TruA [Erysipelothrix urinaevulpis]|uniref:tRNA pseudouridine(38-40) synthase TruA n=1 Tax=Erysipelothrix urinaevulpis TaxID=2683717 RepID=UPI001357A888|nr:tRNA pseudouridine(38-40) synthase TruA [Erysipelothrix urinaevulpis]